MEKSELETAGYKNLGLTLLNEHKKELLSMVSLMERRKYYALAMNSTFIRKIKRAIGHKSAKPFLIELFKPGDLGKFTFINELVNSSLIRDEISKYLGPQCKLHGMGLWYSPKNVSMQKSQRYHFDHGEPKTLVKVFILLSDVNEENGPFSFFDAKTSNHISKRLKLSNGKTRVSRKLSDTEVNLTNKSNTDIITHTGPFGSAFIVDPIRCTSSRSAGSERA